MFNPLEDSTIGVEIQRSASRVDEDVWFKTDAEDELIYSQFAKELMKYLMMPKQSSDAKNKNSDDKNVESPESEHFKPTAFDDAFVKNVEISPEVNKKNSSSKQTRPSAPPMKQETSERPNDKGQSSRRSKGSAIPDDLVKSTQKLLNEKPEKVDKMDDWLFVDTMDFAGQPVYSVTHPVFLPRKGIFLLVHNLEKDAHLLATPMVRQGSVEEQVDDHSPLTNMDHLEFWVSLIAAGSTAQGFPPVFVVCTHADKATTDDARKKAKTKARKILSHLQRKDFCPGNHVQKGLYIIDNTISGTGHVNNEVEKLKKDLTSKARSLPHCKEDIPFRWIQFEKKIVNMVKENERKSISYKEMEEIAKECDINDPEEQSTLLAYLHDLRVIIYFPETEVIIIDTQWLIDMFAKVITVPPIEEHEESYRKQWNELEEGMIRDVKFLEHLWKDLLDEQTTVQALITIMDRFCLICQLEDGSFLIPGMLMNAPESNQLDQSKMCYPLTIRFKSSHLPFGLFMRLVVRAYEMCKNKWPQQSKPRFSKNVAR